MGKGRRAVTVISIIIFVCVLAFVLYKLFQVREITVTGCETLDPDHIISLSGLEYEQSVFEVDEQKILSAIDIEALIKPVAVNIRYPDCVDIIIEERKKAACIEKEGALLIIDYEGYLLEVITQTQDVNYPKIFGLHFNEFTVGKRLEVPDEYKLGVLSNVLYEANISGINLVKIDIELAADIIIEMEPGYTIEIGDDANLAAKFELVKSSIQKLTSMGKNSGTLDVSVVSQAYYREK